MQIHKKSILQYIYAKKREYSIKFLVDNFQESRSHNAHLLFLITKLSNNINELKTNTYNVTYVTN
jgi:hypothetical protein